MAKRSVKEFTHAEARYHALVYELQLLTLAFPHLREAYDADDLPIPFLLARGAARADAKAARAKKHMKKR